MARTHTENTAKTVWKCFFGTVLQTRNIPLTYGIQKNSEHDSKIERKLNRNLFNFLMTKNHAPIINKLFIVILLYFPLLYIMKYDNNMLILKTKYLKILLLMLSISFKSIFNHIHSIRQCTKQCLSTIPIKHPKIRL